MRSSVSVVAGVLLALALTSAVRANEVESATAGSVPQGWAYDMWHDLMSPFCPGRTLAECPSPQADELRLWILTQEAAGTSRADVERILFERFGDEILSAPRPEGWGLAAYLIPGGVCLAAGAVLVFGLRRLVGRSSADRESSRVSPDPAPEDPELEQIVDEELRRLGSA